MLPDQAGRTRRVEGVHSTAAIGGHPIHPMVIPFPIAFLTATLGTDIAYVRTRDPFWARASQWLLRAGLASGAAAAVFGAADWTTIRQARSNTSGILHAAGNAAALALAYGNLHRRRGNRERAIDDGGLVLSASVAALLGATALAGGELVYKHGIGVAGHGHDDGHGHGSASDRGGADGRSGTDRRVRASWASEPRDGEHVRWGRAPGVPVEDGHEQYGRARLRGGTPYQTQLRGR